MLSTWTDLEFCCIVKSLCKTVVTYKPIQKYVSDPYQSLSSVYIYIRTQEYYNFAGCHDTFVLLEHV